MGDPLVLGREGWAAPYRGCLGATAHTVVMFCKVTESVNTESPVLGETGSGKKCCLLLLQLGARNSKFSPSHQATAKRLHLSIWGLQINFSK